MNRKMITSLVAVLICISMIAAGYSVWIVVETAETKATPQVQAYTVSSDEVGVTAAVVAETGKTNPINLASDGIAYDYNWIAFNTASKGKEDLSFDLQITLQPKVNGTATAWSTWAARTDTKTKVIKIWLSGFEISNNTYDGKRFLDAPTNGEDTYVLISYDTTNATETNPGTWKASLQGVIPIGWGAINFDDTAGTLTLPLNLSWGSAFNSQNPNKYFNTKTSEPTPTDLDKLTKLASVTNFKVTVTVQMH